MAHTYSSSLSLSFYLRCIQDPQIAVNVSKTMSMQYTPPDISEDCLYLNVYVPPDSTSADKLAVGQRDIGVDKITETPNSVDAIQLMMD